MLRKLLVGLLLTVGTVALLAGPVAAQASNEVVAGGEHVVTIPMWAWAMLTGTVLPIVVGIVTKAQATPGVTVLLTLVLDAVAAIAGSAVVMDGVATISASTFVLVGLTLIQHVATYFGVWKPLGTRQKLAPTFGLG